MVAVEMLSVHHHDVMSTIVRVSLLKAFDLFLLMIVALDRGIFIRFARVVVLSRSVGMVVVVAFGFPLIVA